MSQEGGSVAVTTAAILHSMSELKAFESYNRSLGLIRRGELEAAVLELLESIFYAPQNANPVVALAEVYVLLGDLQSAVHLYRRAVWVLTRRERERARAEAARAAEEDRQTFLTSHCPQLVLSDGRGGAGAIPGPASALRSPAIAGALVAPGSIAIPDTLAGRQTAGASPSTGGGDAFASDAGVPLSAVRVRLAGLLDGLGLALYSMNSFAQALRFCDDALEVLQEAGASSAPAAHAAKSAPVARAELTLAPTVELHRCVYLMALHREEEAERLLEAHHERHAHLRVQSSSLLVQLYVNRQAFRSAREVLEAHTGAAVRQERALTIAQHIFNDKYRRYRAKALEKRDLGTISQCIEVYPSDTELLYARARIHIEKGELKRSVKDLFKCIKESNSTHREAVDAMTEVLIQIGKESSGASSAGATDDADDAGGRRSVEEAITYYSESLKWRADNTNVLLARADCYMRIEDYESALQDYRRILQLLPDDPVALQRIAVLHDVWGRKLYASGRVREAEAEFTNAIRTDGEEALFYYHRALCRFELGEPRYGLRDVLSCQQLNPADPKLRAFIVRYLGTDEAPVTRGGAASGGDVRGEAVARRTLPAVQAVAARRAAALYGRPSARVAKAVREAHDACVTVANNGGVTECAVREVLMPSAPTAAGGGGGGAAGVGGGGKGGRYRKPPARPGGLGAAGAHHLSYRDYVAYQGEVCRVSSTAGPPPPLLLPGRGGRGGVVGQLTGAKTQLHKRQSV